MASLAWPGLLCLAWCDFLCLASPPGLIRRRAAPVLVQLRWDSAPL